MRPYHSILVFLFFAISSALAGMKSYDDARQLADTDLHHALVQTMSMQQCDVITPDTIANYRANLSIIALRDSAYLSYSLRGKIEGRCSMAAIWHISDQRLSAVLSLLAAFWAISSVFWFRRKVKQQPLPTMMEMPADDSEALTLGGLRYSSADSHFYDACGHAVHLTPMQHQLLTMFFTAPSHELSRLSITETLWPKKPDATETLHTLVRRLKTVLATCSTLTISADRGRSYRLDDV